MTNNSQDSTSLPLPISQSARRTAQQFASEQPNPDKRQQVQQNTLAVSVVNDYLQLMGIETDLETADSWRSIPRLCADVADLKLPGLGRLECRPVSEQAQVCTVPADVWNDFAQSDRIGYVFVQIAESLQWASILGFIRTVSTEQIAFHRLQSPEELLDYLHELRQPLIQLSQWMQGAIETGWQTVESLLSGSPAVSFRQSDATTGNIVRQAKRIDLGIRLQTHPIALIVEIQPGTDQQMDILIQIRPLTGLLPPDLQLLVLDAANEQFLEARSRSADAYIQLQFSGDLGEQFKVSVALEDAEITEAFLI